MMSSMTNATTPPGSAESVVVGVDGSASSIRAARWAAAAARQYGLPLQIVHAAVPPPVNAYPAMAEYIETLHRASIVEGEEHLETAAEAVLDSVPDLTVVRWQAPGDPVAELSRASAAARIVVVGATGKTGLEGLLVGSTALTLPSRSHCPVVVVRQRSDGADAVDGAVVVGVSGARLDEPAIAFAFAEADMRGTELIAVHSWSDSLLPDVDRLTGFRGDWNVILERERRLLAESMAGYRERYPGVTVRPVVVYDRPSRALLDHARRAQLLVVGTHGRGPITRALLGSTSRAVMKLAPCPVAVVAPGR